MASQLRIVFGQLVKESLMADEEAVEEIAEVCEEIAEAIEE